MPNNTSLIARLATLRRSYTGETQCAVLPEIRIGLEGLDSAGRADLVGYFGGSLGGPISVSVKAALIPDASSLTQQWLEAAVLDAASRVVPQWSQVFWAVRPRVHELILHVQPEALGPLLRQLLPREGEHGLCGVPGLRGRVHRRHVELYLLDSDPPASVVLAGVSYRRWTTLLDQIDTLGNPLRWLGNDARPLSPTELDSRHRKYESAIMSAVLRRIRLFPVLPEVTVLPGGCTLDWLEGPSTARAMLALQHRLAGTSMQVCEGTDTHLALGAADARLLLRGPDLHPVPRTPALI